MKRSLRMLAIAILLTLKVIAQTDPVRTELDQIFYYIDKGQVPSGYLDEYGPQFAVKKWYTGTLADSNIIQGLTGFRLLYNDIEQARIYAAAPAITPLTTVNTTISQLPVGGSTPLIFLVSKYATLKEEAINLNLFSKYGSNQIKDVPGRTQSPYNAATNFFAACPVETDAPKTDTISLTYNPTLVYTNCSKTISSVAVNFLKGAGYQTIAANTTINSVYNDSSGIKKFTIRVLCSDGTTYYCYSQQYVKVKTIIGGQARYAPLTPAEIANPTFTIPKVSGQHESGKVYIRYSQLRKGTSLENKLVKPFIVVEGYDLHDAAPNLGSKENNSINSLLTEWNDLAVSTTNPFDLNKELDETAGYDLVYVDYFTMDYIENNALMLEKVIDQLNTLKVNNAVGVREKNVIMGISLGGVLARYTLAKMTKNRGTASTDTRLFLSYDSPHQGGNVPLGFQHFLQDFGEVKIFGVKLKTNSKELNEFYNLNAQPATSQLLLYKVPNGGGTVEYNTFFSVGGPYRSMVDFTASQQASTPPLYEFKAISQASQCGVQVLQPGALLSKSTEEVATARSSALFGLVLNKYKLSVQINALPTQGTVGGQISNTIMQRNIKLFLGVIGTGWKTTYNTGQPRIAPTGLIPWDGVPGGTSSASARSGGSFGSFGNTPTIKKDNNLLENVIGFLAVTTGLLQIDYYISIPFQQDIFTTVPVSSSLDIQNATSATLSRSFFFPIDGRANSTSTKYIANESFNGNLNGVSTTLYNYPHADFTKRQAQWMFNEMENNNNDVLNCQGSNECSFTTTYTINGPDIICNTGNFAVNNLVGTSSVTWSISPNYSVLQLSSIPPLGQQLLITNNRWYGYSGRLFASFNNPCTGSAIILSKSLYNDNGNNTTSFSYRQYSCSYYNVTHPAESGTVTASSATFVHMGCTVEVNVGALPGGNTLTFEPTSTDPITNPIFWNYDGAKLQFQLPYGSGGIPFTFKISGNGACSDRMFVFFTYSNNSRMAAADSTDEKRYLFSFNPNPVTSTLMITAQENSNVSNVAAAKSIYQIHFISRVYELNTNTLVMSAPSGIGERTQQINVSQLRPGFYVLQIVEGDQIHNIKFLKQ